MASASNKNDTKPPSPPDGLRDLLCPPVPARADEFDEFRLQIKAVIRPCLPDYEEKIGLTASSPQFVEDLVEAILFCILVNRAPPERLSAGRNRLLSISNDAQSGADILQRLDAAFQQTTLVYPAIFRRFLVLGKQTPELIALSKLARAHAEALPPDKGGQRGMIAFRTLIGSLARAFAAATGRAAKVTWNYKENRYEGKFFNLCEAVFSTVLQLCPNMPHPHTDYDRGRLMYEITRTRRQSHPKRARKSDKKPTGRRA
jgi:hypothetical protein